MQIKKFVAVSVAAALMSTTAIAQQQGDPVIDGIVSELAAEGYARIEVRRTLLGRVRIAARGNGYEREIILNPRTGEILRDFWDKEDGDVA